LHTQQVNSNHDNMLLSAHQVYVAHVSASLSHDGGCIIYSAFATFYTMANGLQDFGASQFSIDKLNAHLFFVATGAHSSTTSATPPTS
jgi:hypothetical protein